MKTVTVFWILVTTSVFLTLGEPAKAIGNRDQNQRNIALAINTAAGSRHNTLRVYAFDSGKKGAALGLGHACSKKTSQIKIKATQGPILVEVSGRSKTLHAMVSGLADNTSITVSPLTEEAYRYALSVYDVKIDAANIDASNSKISSYFGFDIVSTVPASLKASKFRSASQASQSYALALTRFGGRKGLNNIDSDVADLTDNGRFDGLNKALDQIKMYLDSDANTTGITGIKDLSATALAKAASLQSLLDSIIADPNYQVPGVTLAVKQANGFAWNGASGLADTATREPMTAMHRFRIGSITKTFTAMLIIRYAQEGKLFLDDPVSKWLPDLKSKLTTLDLDKITIQNLLNHTSGIRTYTDKDDPIFKGTYADHKTIWNADQIYSVINKNGSEFAPGTSWNYSNSNYYLLGRIAEAVSGNTYENEVALKLLTPMGLHNTSVPSAGDSTMGRDLYAHGYSNFDGTGMREFSETDPSYPYAAGSMISTVRDLIVWGRELALGGQILDPPYQDKHLTFVKLGEYGYGLGIISDGPYQLVGHTGQIFGYDCTVEYNIPHDMTLSACINRELFDSDAKTDTNLLVVYKALDRLFPTR